MHSNAHFGGIDREDRAAIFPRQDTPSFHGLPAPGIEAKDTVGFRDRIPAFDIGQLAPVHFAPANVPAAEATPQRLHLFCCETHHRVLTLRTGSGSDKATPLISAPSLSSLNRS